MKISFVIPAYNEEAYLPLCLDAVIKEKNKEQYDMEIIVVNNASTDSTRAVALSYPGVKVVDETKKGLSAARQAGFMAATGDLIANIDSDSVLTPGWLDTVMERFSEDSKLVALSGPFIYHDFSVGHNILVRIQYGIDYVVYFINRFVLRISSMIQGGNFVIRKTALDKIGGFNTAYVFYGEDANIAKRLNPLGPVVFTFKLPIYSSGRRLQQDGTLKMSFIYTMNFFSTIFLDKPFSKTFTDIRQSKAKQNPFRTNIYDLNKYLLYCRVAFIFVIFSVMGGSAYLYDRTVESLKPQTASASVVSTNDPYLVKEVRSSVKKIKDNIKVLKDKLKD